MGMPWEGESDNLQWSDREAWRGDVHDEDADAWRGEHAAESREAEPALETTEPGTLDPAEDWPEDLAGPEYWLYKRDGL